LIRGVGKMVMHRMTVILILLITYTPFAFAELSFTNGYKGITEVYINGTNQKKFSLEQDCPLINKFYVLDSTKVDVNVFYSTVLAAFTAGKSVYVGWAPNGNNCSVQRINVKN